MARKRYDPKIKALAKKAFVDDNKTFKEIAALIDGKISPSVIHKWASEPDSDGKTWKDYRKEVEEVMYQQLSPQAIAKKLYDKLSDLIQQQGMDPAKFADSVAKLTTSMTSIMDHRYQIGMIFQTLDDILEFAERKFCNVEKEKLLFLAELLAGYRDEVRGRL